jgi:hypothetical protein
MASRRDEQKSNSFAAGLDRDLIATIEELTASDFLAPSIGPGFPQNSPQATRKRAPSSSMISRV